MITFQSVSDQVLAPGGEAVLSVHWITVEWTVVDDCASVHPTCGT